MAQKIIVCGIYFLFIRSHGSRYPGEKNLVMKELVSATKSGYIRLYPVTSGYIRLYPGLSGYIHASYGPKKTPEIPDFFTDCLSRGAGGWIRGVPLYVHWYT